MMRKKLWPKGPEHLESTTACLDWHAVFLCGPNTRAQAILRGQRVVKIIVILRAASAGIIPGG